MDVNLIRNLKARFFKAKQETKTNIGLDWGLSSIKVVVLQSQNNTYLLKDVRIIELPSPSRDLNLSSLIKDLDLSGGINLGICGPNVVVRYVSMAKMDESEFKSSLRYEAAQHLPFSPEEANLDGAILKDLPDNQMLVMLAAAKKDFVNQRVKVFRESGIKVSILDIDSLALINTFNYIHSTVQGGNTLSGAVVLLNIGATVTNINILEDGIPHFSRDLDVACRDFVKKNHGEVTIVNLVSEIRKSFDYYEAGSTASINKIFLSGGGSLFPGLFSNLEKLLGIKIEQWNPFSNFEFAPGLDEVNIRGKSVQFAVAVGLALRSRE